MAEKTKPKKKHKIVLRQKDMPVFDSNLSIPFSSIGSSFVEGNYHCLWLDVVTWEEMGRPSKIEIVVRTVLDD